MVELVTKDQADRAWCPVAIEKLDSLLLKAIQAGYGYPHIYALRRNIAYNLQHLQFLDRCLQDLKLRSVLITQTWKMMILIGCGLVECLLHYLLIKRGLHATEEWDLKTVLPGNQKKIDGEFVKCDSHIYSKLDRPRLRHMTFDAMLKKAKSNKVLGSDDSIYEKLDCLRKLRNKIHLHVIDQPTDTDWNAFHQQEIADMAAILYKVFTSNIFKPSTEEIGYFDYLRKYFET